MICKHCGREIPDNSTYCIYCGYKQDEVIRTVKKGSSFKSGVKALFSKFMLFEGRSSRSEFNFGLLFLLILMQVVSMFILVPYMMDMMEMMMNTQGEAIEEVTYSGMIDPISLMSMIISVVMSIFLAAPIYRRFNDCGFTKKIVTILTVVFLLGQLSIFTVFIPYMGGLTMVIDLITSLLSLASSVLLFLAILRKSAL